MHRRALPALGVVRQLDIQTRDRARTAGATTEPVRSAESTRKEHSAATRPRLRSCTESRSELDPGRAPNCVGCCGCLRVSVGGTHFDHRPLRRCQKATLWARSSPTSFSSAVMIGEAMTAASLADGCGTSHRAIRAECCAAA
jgi:hypothetical protein